MDGTGLPTMTSDQKEVCRNGQSTGSGESSVVIEMSSSTKVSLTDDQSQPDESKNYGNESGDDAQDDDLFDENCCTRAVQKVQEKVYTFLDKRKLVIFGMVKGLVFLAFLVYVTYCLWFQFGDEGSYTLLGITVFGMLIALKRTVPFRNRCLSSFTTLWGGTRKAQRLRQVWRWTLRLAVVVFMVTFLVVDVLRENPENLQSLIGLVGFIVVLFCVSYNPSKVNWHPVFWGIAVQWVLALIVLRTSWGLLIFKWMGDRLEEFLNFGLAGAEFVFDKDYYRHRLAMVTVSIMLFFNSVIFILFHLGVIQAIINSLGRFLAFCLGTNPIDSFAASSNIFLSLTETSLMLRPFLKYMTKSELHTLMTCGFASIAGGVFGTYVQFGIQANHLVTASIMSAPAALAVSKLMCPETKVSKLKDAEAGDIGNMRYRNVLQAASSGAVQATPLAAATLANQIAFVSLLAFFNSILKWLGNRAGVQGVTFKWLCSYLFYPLVLAMGTESSDCRTLGSLLGMKLFGTPIISYITLADLRNNRLQLEDYVTSYPNATWVWQGEDILLELTNSTLVDGVISERSEVIATYMLCGFSAITTIGVCLGSLIPMVPERKNEIIDLVVNALVAGNFASFLTAAIAGLMFSGKPLPT